MPYRMSHYTQHFSPNAFETGPVYPWYSTTYLNSSTPLTTLGEFWEMTGQPYSVGGNGFMYVKADSALAAGELVTWATPAASTVENPLTAASTTQKVECAAFNPVLTTNSEAGNFISLTPAGGTTTLRRILSNTATNIVFSTTDFTQPSNPADPDAISARCTAGSAVQIIRPYHVVRCDATHVPMGLTLGTVTSGNYTIVQVFGYGEILSDGDGANEDITVNELAIPAAAGNIKGSNATAAVYLGGGTIYPQAASSAAAGTLVPCLFNFVANL